MTIDTAKGKVAELASRSRAVQKFPCARAGPQLGVSAVMVLDERVCLYG